MKTFLDITGNKIEFSFLNNAFQEEAKHVLVICQYGGDWVLTQHKKRGLEFPGGKMEPGETIEETAHREVYEETGAVLSELIRIGEYRVSDPNGPFVKAVFWGRVEQLHKKDSYLETNGPVVVKGNLLQERFGREYSFIMKDQVVEECLKRIEKTDVLERSDPS